jgi:hypothetical protein
MRRYSPVRQPSRMANVLTHGEDNEPNRVSDGKQPHYDRGAGVGNGYGHCQGATTNANAHWDSREGAVGPHGEARHHPEVLSFQEQQFRYTQQALGPLP